MLTFVSFVSFDARSGMKKYLPVVADDKTERQKKKICNIVASWKCGCLFVQNFHVSYCENGGKWCGANIRVVNVGDYIHTCMCLFHFKANRIQGSIQLVLHCITGEISYEFKTSCPFPSYCLSMTTHKLKVNQRPTWHSNIIACSVINLEVFQHHKFSSMVWILSLKHL